ncbi:MAG TPA: hypothetical protein VIQ29_25095 [Ancylobacter sp.]
MDELLTIQLTMADSLPKLWNGIAVGIDGNPPLYLTLAWLLAHATPEPIPVVAVLRAANLMLIMAAVFLLYRVSLRAASRLAAWAGGFLFVAMNANLVVLAFDLRTYAIYFMLSALAVLLQQRLIERDRSSDATWLGLSYVALALSHNFGIVYVVCIALSGALSQWNQLRSQGWRCLRLSLFAVIPALVVFGCWFPVFMQQSATGLPYLWIDKPDLPQLLLIMWSSPLSVATAIVELCCLISATIMGLRTHGIAGYRAFLGSSEGQYARYVVLLTLSISGFTLTVWTVSVLLFPIFVPRYFVPQMMVGFALHVAFCELVVRTLKERFQVKTARLARWAAVILPLLFSLTLLRGPVPGREPCTDDNNAYFETRLVDGTLPVIVESPHVFLPRAAFAAHAGAYRFALDWDVVLKYPQRSRGNATEFHVLQRLKAWQPVLSVMETNDIVNDYPEFLVIEQSGQAWFENLRQTRDVAAERLAQVSGSAGDVCTLWKVTSVKARL